MDLKSGHPFWLVKDGLPAAFPALRNDIQCDVVVIGAGITGALVAHALAHADLDVVVLDKRDVGWGSTCASTALLQYEIDTELVDLAKRFGEDLAVRAYRACEDAIAALRDICRSVRQSDFKAMRSLYLASHWYHVRRLRAELALRRKHGFAVDGVERAELLDRFSIRAPFALLTQSAAQVDPYLLTYSIFRKLNRGGVRIYDRSAVLHWSAQSRGLRVCTDAGCAVACKHLVVAAGYESARYLRQSVARNHSTYALATEPLPEGLGFLKDTLLWESARPYLYLRSTADGRIIAGGEDDRVDVAAKRDACVVRKSQRLIRKMNRLLPAMSMEPSFAWAGTFGETRDGLPYFGPHPEHGPRVLFAMAYGGNGITFSAIGAQILRARIQRASHPLMKFFSFDRLLKMP